MTQPFATESAANDNAPLSDEVAKRTVLFWHHRLSLATLRGELELAAEYRAALARAFERIGAARVAELLASAPKS